MKIAFANAGLWFFGTLIFVLVFAHDKTESDWYNLMWAAIAAIIVGCARFFYLWYEELERERKKSSDYSAM